MDRHPETRGRMVDITSKDVTAREATAEGLVEMSGATRDLVLGGEIKKGDVLETARIAGIMAAKKTSEMIPLCHPIGLGSIDLIITGTDRGLLIEATVKTAERTGVEMEALTAVAVAGLTVYDMVKGTERGVEITGIRLLRKAGGRSGEWVRPSDV